MQILEVDIFKIEIIITRRLAQETFSLSGHECDEPRKHFILRRSQSTRLIFDVNLKIAPSFQPSTNTCGTNLFKFVKNKFAKIIQKKKNIIFEKTKIC